MKKNNCSCYKSFISCMNFFVFIVLLVMFSFLTEVKASPQDTEVKTLLETLQTKLSGLKDNLSLLKDSLKNLFEKTQNKRELAPKNETLEFDAEKIEKSIQELFVQKNNYFEQLKLSYDLKKELNRIEQELEKIKLFNTLLGSGKNANIYNKLTLEIDENSPILYDQEIEVFDESDNRYHISLPLSQIFYPNARPSEFNDQTFKQKALETWIKKEESKIAEQKDEQLNLINSIEDNLRNKLSNIHHQEKKLFEETTSYYDKIISSEKDLPNALSEISEDAPDRALLERFKWAEIFIFIRSDKISKKDKDFFKVLVYMLGYKDSPDQAKIKEYKTVLSHLLEKNKKLITENQDEFIEKLEKYTDTTIKDAKENFDKALEEDYLLSKFFQGGKKIIADYFNNPDVRLVSFLWLLEKQQKTESHHSIEKFFQRFFYYLTTDQDKKLSAQEQFSSLNNYHDSLLIQELLEKLFSEDLTKQELNLTKNNQDFIKTLLESIKKKDACYCGVRDFLDSLDEKLNKDGKLNARLFLLHNLPALNNSEIIFVELLKLVSKSLGGCAPEEIPALFFPLVYSTKNALLEDKKTFSFYEDSENITKLPEYRDFTLALDTFKKAEENWKNFHKKNLFYNQLQNPDKPKAKEKTLLLQIIEQMIKTPAHDKHGSNSR